MELDELGVLLKNLKNDSPNLIFTSTVTSCHFQSNSEPKRVSLQFAPPALGIHCHPLRYGELEALLYVCLLEGPSTF